MIELKRYWINQPSALQDYHRFHGTNVIGVKSKDNITTIAFLDEIESSMEIRTNALSRGWDRY